MQQLARHDSAGAGPAATLGESPQPSWASAPELAAQARETLQLMEQQLPVFPESEDSDELTERMRLLSMSHSQARPRLPQVQLIAVLAFCATACPCRCGWCRCCLCPGRGAVAGACRVYVCAASATLAGRVNSPCTLCHPARLMERLGSHRMRLIGGSAIVYV